MSKLLNQIISENKVTAVAEDYMADLRQDFEITPAIDKFLEEYKLANQVDILEEGLHEDDIEEDTVKFGRLKPEYIDKLAKTKETFFEGNHAQEHRESIESGMVQTINEVIKETVPNLVGGLSVSADVIEKTDSSYVDVRLTDASGEEYEFQPLYHTQESGLALAEGASSWDWAAWFGIESSPFYDTSFVEAYDEINNLQAMDELGSYFKESQDYWDLKALLEQINADYTPTYLYVIDLNERGYFRAHVEDPQGKVVFNLTNEDEETGRELGGELWLVEDGFMKHIDDVNGLEKYLKSVQIMPSRSTLKEG